MQLNSDAGESPNQGLSKIDLNGTKPVTDRSSKMVMLRGERGDKLLIEEVVDYFDEIESLPVGFKIIQRLATYYGTELQLKPSQSEDDSTYMLTAPGPDTFLYLWASETDSDGFRVGWSKIAEIKASFSDQLPKYPICSDCGEPIKSLEHERLAAIDQCDSLID